MKIRVKLPDGEIIEKPAISGGTIVDGGYVAIDSAGELFYLPQIAEDCVWIPIEWDQIQVVFRPENFR